MLRGIRVKSKEELVTRIYQYFEEINKNGAVVFTEYGLMDETSSLKYRKECVDCRQTAGATKKRPDFWPNNHE